MIKEKEKRKKILLILQKLSPCRKEQGTRLGEDKGVRTGFRIPILDKTRQSCTEFQLYKMKRIMETGGGGGCPTLFMHL